MPQDPVNWVEASRRVDVLGRRKETVIAHNDPLPARAPPDRELGLLIS
jgi:hypothetical protein